MILGLRWIRNHIILIFSAGYFKDARIYCHNLSFLKTLGLSHFLKDNEQATVIELTETIKMIKDLFKGCFNHCHQIKQDQNG